MNDSGDSCVRHFCNTGAKSSFKSFPSLFVRHDLTSYFHNCLKDLNTDTYIVCRMCLEFRYNQIGSIPLEEQNSHTCKLKYGTCPSMRKRIGSLMLLSHGKRTQPLFFVCVNPYYFGYSVLNFQYMAMDSIGTKLAVNNKKH